MSDLANATIALVLSGFFLTAGMTGNYYLAPPADYDRTIAAEQDRRARQEVDTSPQGPHPRRADPDCGEQDFSDWCTGCQDDCLQPFNPEPE